MIDAASTLKDEREIEKQYRLHIFQSVLKDVIQQFKDPNIMINLKDEMEEQDFWATVDLRLLVQRRVLKEAMNK